MDVHKQLNSIYITKSEVSIIKVIAKVQIKHLYLLSNVSKWLCHHCNTLIRLKAMITSSVVIGFFSASVPAFLLLIILDYPFYVGMFAGLGSASTSYNLRGSLKRILTISPNCYSVKPF